MTELRRGRQTTIEATPEPITIDTARTAVIVVDMQNDFGTKGGVFDRAGIDIAPIQKVVTPISKVLRISPPRGLKSGLTENGLSPGPFGSRPSGFSQQGALESVSNKGSYGRTGWNSRSRFD